MMLASVIGPGDFRTMAIILATTAWFAGTALLGGTHLGLETFFAYRDTRRAFRASGSSGRRMAAVKEGTYCHRAGANLALRDSVSADDSARL